MFTQLLSFKEIMQPKINIVILNKKWLQINSKQNKSYFRKHIKMGFCRTCHGTTAVYQNLF